MGFNPYSRIRRNRMTRAGDLVFVLSFTAVIVALIVWAML